MHDQKERHWAAVAVSLGDRLGKKPSDLTLTRVLKHRQRQEKLNHIFKSIPVSECMGESLWLLTLRDSYTRYVPIGNVFSGLFVEISKLPPERQNLPLEIFGKPDACDPSKSSVAMKMSMKRGMQARVLLKTQEEKGRAWMQGSYLQVRAFTACCHITSYCLLMFMSCFDVSMDMYVTALMSIIAWIQGRNIKSVVAQQLTAHCDKDGSTFVQKKSDTS